MAVGKKFLDLIFRVDTKNANKDVDDLGKGLKGVGSSGKIASGGLKMVGGGIKFIGNAIKAAGIGLLIGLLSQLTGIFQSNQKVADTFGRIMLKLKPIFDALGDVIAFVAGVLEDLIDLFTGAIDWIGSLIGVTDNAANSMSNMAGEVVQLRNDVKLMNAELALTQLEYQKEAELQRQLRDDTSKSIDERIAANEELGRILAKQAEEERFMAEEGLRLAKMELRLDRDNIEMQVAVIEAKTKLAEIDERITGQRSEQLTNLNGLEQERATQQEERSKKIKENLEAEKKAYQDIRKEMTKNINAEEEDTSLKAQLESSAKAFEDAKKHLNTLREKESKQIQSQINNNNQYTQEGLEQLKLFHSYNVRDLLKQEEHYNDAVESGSKTRISVQETHMDSRERAVKQSLEKITEYEANMTKEAQENAQLRTKITQESAKTEKEITDATILFEQTQATLKAQAQAVVDEFRKDADKKEIDAIKKKYKEIIDLTEEDSLDRQELIKERDALIKDITERDANELKELIAKNQKELSDLNKSAEELEIEELNTKYQVMLDMADELKMSEVEIEKMKQEEINGVKKHYSDLELEEQKARNQQTIDNALSMVNSLLSISKTQADKEIKQLDQKLKKGKITEQQYNRELLRIEQDQLRKEKKAALLQIGVDTASGISSAVKAGAGLTFPANLAAITTGIAAVLAGVAQASSVLGQSVEGVDGATSDVAGAGGGGDLSGDVPGLPTFGAIGTDAPPIQAFVVESDVSNAQALQSELDLQGTL